MIRRQPRSTLSSSSAASDVYKRQVVSYFFSALTISEIFEDYIHNKKIKDEILSKLKGNLNLDQINQIKTDLFGKNGLISSQFKRLGSIESSERKKFASDLNFAKDELQNLIGKKIQYSHE